MIRGDVSLPNAVRPIWLEAVITSDFERSTLPLLFASDETYRDYYRLLAARNSSLATAVQHLQARNYQAREQCKSGHHEDCIASLLQCVHLRRCIFEEDDFQYVSAVNHLLLCVLQFASDYLRQSITSDVKVKEANLVRAFDFFKRAQDTLTMVTHVGHRAFFKAMISNNFANYFYRRHKPKAATQCALDAMKAFSRARVTQKAFYFQLTAGTSYLSSARFEDAIRKLSNAHTAVKSSTEGGGSSQGTPPPVEFDIVMLVGTIPIATACELAVCHNMAAANVGLHKYNEAEKWCNAALEVAAAYDEELKPSHQWLRNVQRTLEYCQKMEVAARAAKSKPRLTDIPPELQKVLGEGQSMETLQNNIVKFEQQRQHQLVQDRLKAQQNGPTKRKQSADPQVPILKKGGINVLQTYTNSSRQQLVNDLNGTQPAPTLLQTTYATPRAKTPNTAAPPSTDENPPNSGVVNDSAEDFPAPAATFEEAGQPAHAEAVDDEGDAKVSGEGEEKPTGDEAEVTGEKTEILDAQGTEPVVQETPASANEPPAEEANPLSDASLQEAPDPVSVTVADVLPAEAAPEGEAEECAPVESQSPAAEEPPVAEGTEQNTPEVLPPVADSAGGTPAEEEANETEVPTATNDAPEVTASAEETPADKGGDVPTKDDDQLDGLPQFKVPSPDVTPREGQEEEPQTVADPPPVDRKEDTVEEGAASEEIIAAAQQPVDVPISASNEPQDERDDENALAADTTEDGGGRPVTAATTARTASASTAPTAQRPQTAASHQSSEYSEYSGQYTDNYSGVSPANSRPHTRQTLASYDSRENSPMQQRPDTASSRPFSASKRRPSTSGSRRGSVSQRRSSTAGSPTTRPSTNEKSLTRRSSRSSSSLRPNSAPKNAEHSQRKGTAESDADGQYGDDEYDSPYEDGDKDGSEDSHSVKNGSDWNGSLPPSPPARASSAKQATKGMPMTYNDKDFSFSSDSD